MEKIAVYGSLRPGCYNFDRIADYFGHDSIKPVESNVNLRGYKMYTVCTSYPGIKKDDYTTVVVDIIEVNQDAYEFIKGMEIGAGYVEETAQVGEHTCKVYLYTGETSVQNVVHTGDWLQKIEYDQKLNMLYGS